MSHHCFVTDNSDYAVVTGPASAQQLTSSRLSFSYLMDLPVDGIVLEGEESFSLHLQQSGGQQSVTVFINTMIRVQDSDGKWAPL